MLVIENDVGELFWEVFAPIDVYKLCENLPIQFIIRKDTSVLGVSNFCTHEVLVICRQYTIYIRLCFYSKIIRIKRFSCFLFEIIIANSLNFMWLLLFLFSSVLTLNLAKFPNQDDQKEHGSEITQCADNPRSVSLDCDFFIVLILQLVDFKKPKKEQHIRQQHQNQHRHMSPHYVLFEMFHHLKLFNSTPKAPESISEKYDRAQKQNSFRVCCYQV